MLTRYDYGDTNSRNVLIQLVGEHDLAQLPDTVETVSALAGEDFCLTALKVDDWNRELSPWKAPAVFPYRKSAGDALPVFPCEKNAGDALPVFSCEKSAGDALLVFPGRQVAGDALSVSDEEGFGEGARETLDRVLETASDAGKRYFIGGYSLAGLFALWAVYQTDVFAGAAAVSPSVWFPGFVDYMKEKEILTGKVYLSLGDREERTGNPVMRTVGRCIREGYEILEKNGVDSVLEWNKGNHFKDPGKRVGKGFGWLLGRMTEGAAKENIAKDDKPESSENN